MNIWHFSRDQKTETPLPNTCSAAQGAGWNTSLWQHLLARENITASWERVRNNRGAPGIDGITIEQLAPRFEHEWDKVDTALRSGSWQPQPLRRVSLQKNSGGVRNLGIPTVMDRVVHQAVSQSLTPFWEMRFSSYSFAYRRGLGIREALLSLVSQAREHGISDVWHLDIQNFFDSVPRPQAIHVVRHVTEEKEVLELTQAILDSGIFTGGRILPTPAGLPQGSPLSPLLANGVLHHFDIWLTEQSLPFVRYADDIVILLPPGHTPEKWYSSVKQRLALLGLTLNEAKTSHGSLATLAFLGFHFFKDSQNTWRRRISPTSWNALETELQRRQNSFISGEHKPASPTDYFNGWLTHFGCTECPWDKERLANLSSILNQKKSRESVRIRPSYDGSPPSSSPHTPFHLFPDWRRTLKLWVIHIMNRRWIRINLDWGRRKNGFYLQAIHLSLGPLNFRFRI